MAYRPSWSKSGVLLVSVILAGIVANLLFETPNVVGGGGAKMLAIIVLMVVFKATIEFFLARWGVHAQLYLPAPRLLQRPLDRLLRLLDARNRHRRHEGIM